MRIIKCLIFALILRARIYQAEIVIPTSNPEESTSRLVEIVVKVVKSCYRDQINTVGLAGNLPDTLARTLSVQLLLPTILMDDTTQTFKRTRVDFLPDQFRQKLKVFIIGATSTKHLLAIIELIMNTSIWRNHMASFFILDQSLGCNNVGNFLYISWQFNVLNAKVICCDTTLGWSIFNYNPFTSQAPVPWRKVLILRAIKNNHPFTIFIREDLENESICLNLDFVKTRNLGGHEIYVDGKANVLAHRSKKFPALSQLTAVRERTLYMLCRALNATPKFSGRTPDINYWPNGEEMTTMYSWNVTQTTYPYQQFGLVIVSKYRGHKTQLEKILYVIDRNSRIGMGIVYLVTLIFLKFFVHQALGPSLLNLIRMTCNTGMAHLPDNNAPRLYLTGLLFFVVTIQGIYQGNLASLLTKKIPVRNVNSFEDLVDMGYKIYGLKSVESFLQHSELKERFTPINSLTKCAEYPVNDSSAACLDFAQGTILDLARYYDLHLSKEFVAQIHAGFLIQPAWYLEEQMNTILGTIMETDIFETWKGKCNPTKLEDFQFDREVLANTDYKVIEFFELRFAFIILGIGLLCATITFIAEVAIY